jgi:hypothetical protein
MALQNGGPSNAAKGPEKRRCRPPGRLRSEEHASGADRDRPVLTRLLRKTRPGETWSRFTDHAGVDFALKRAPPGRVRPCRAIVVADRPRPNIRVTRCKGKRCGGDLLRGERSL